jgi:hypothetical protein
MLVERQIPPASNIKIVASPIDAIDNQIMAICMFVREAMGQHPPDDRPRHRCAGLMDHLITRGPLDASACHLALHRPDDIATLSHAPQRILQIVCQPVAGAVHRLGQTQSRQLGQTPCPQRLIEGITPCRVDLTLGIGGLKQRAVDRGQPLRLHLCPQNGFDLTLSARPQIEIDQLDGALAQPLVI